MSQRWYLCLTIGLALGLLAALPRQATARVVKIEITERGPYAEGKAFGNVGPYERLRGRIQFAIDPAAPAGASIVDIQLAPRNGSGEVEFAADIEILAPADRTRASGTLLYDVNNRGNRVCLGQFSDTFLCARGAIVLWSGWIAEVLPGGDRLRLEAPVATENGREITGLVRAEFAPDSAAEKMTITYGASNGSYRPTERGLRTATLTFRRKEADPRVVVPRDRWRLEFSDSKAQDPPGGLPLVECVMQGGFAPGGLYEIIYEASGPLVQGVGLAGIRDLVSFLRHARGAENPLAGPDGAPLVKRTIGFGVSQSGRCLRQFVYDGFNADEQGRAVFDGIIPHVAGGGLGFFNHRFASPTRHNTQHDNHLYPVDLFPFAYQDEVDPFSGRTDGILRRARAAGVVPKVIHTQTSAEYWTRAGSLVHTDPTGARDGALPEEVRVYAIGGAQHGPGSGEASAPSTGQLAHNPTDYRPLVRALFAALERWIVDGTPPPASVYPRVSDRTLVPWRAAESGWPTVPGVRYPEIISEPEFRDFGPLFLSERKITLHPPQIRGRYRALVAALGPDGNERGVLAVPSVAVPVATFTGWNLRTASIGSDTELLSLAGGYIPFARDSAARAKSGDARPALLERYKDHDDYTQQFTAAAHRLARERYLLPEELPALLEFPARRRPLFEAP